MLKNEYLVTKIGFDTAENEPSEIVKYGCWTTTDRAPCRSGPGWVDSMDEPPSSLGTVATVGNTASFAWVSVGWRVHSAVSAISAGGRDLCRDARLH